MLKVGGSMFFQKAEVYGSVFQKDINPTSLLEPILPHSSLLLSLTSDQVAVLDLFKSFTITGTWLIPALCSDHCGVVFCQGNVDWWGRGS